jgi:hypothetical protein
VRITSNADAPSVVADGQEIAVFKGDLDKARVAGDRLVHRVVEHFRREVV